MLQQHGISGRSAGGFIHPTDQWHPTSVSRTSQVLNLANQERLCRLLFNRKGAPASCHQMIEQILERHQRRTSGTQLRCVRAHDLEWAACPSIGESCQAPAMIRSCTCVFTPPGKQSRGAGTRRSPHPDEMDGRLIWGEHLLEEHPTFGGASNKRRLGNNGHASASFLFPLLELNLLTFLLDASKQGAEGIQELLDPLFL